MLSSANMAGLCLRASENDVCACLWKHTDVASCFRELLLVATGSPCTELRIEAMMPACTCLVLAKPMRAAAVVMR